MKKTALSLLTAISIITFGCQPTIQSSTSIPKSVVQSDTGFVRHAFFDDIDKADAYISRCITDGYEIKIVSASNAGSYGGYYSIFILAEKK